MLFVILVVAFVMAVLVSGRGQAGLNHPGELDRIGNHKRGASRRTTLWWTRQDSSL